jgi:phage terminase small subunit
MPAVPSSVTSAKGKRLWRETVRFYEVAEHELRLLEAACVAWDRLEAAGRAISKQGVTVLDRYGVPKQNPACAVERDARIGLARLLRELRLDGAADPDIRMPRLPKAG